MRWVIATEIAARQPYYEYNVEVIVDAPNSGRRKGLELPYLMKAMNADMFVGITNQNSAAFDGNLLDYVYLWGVKGLEPKEAFKEITRNGGPGII